MKKFPKKSPPKIKFVIIGASSFAIVVTSLTVASADIFSAAGSINNQVDAVINDASTILNKSDKATGTRELQKQVGSAQNTVDKINDYLLKGRSIYRQISSGNFRNILRGLDRLRGALGIPDPYAERQQQLDQAKENPVDAQDSANVLDRGVASGVASTEVLGKDGQDLMDAEAQQVEAAVEQTSAVVDDSAAASAQSETAVRDSLQQKVSQNILRNISRQQLSIAQQTQVLTEQQALIAQIEQHHSNQLASLQKINAASLLTQSNISSTLDQQAQIRQLEEQTVRAREVQASNAIYLPKLSNNTFTSASTP